MRPRIPLLARACGGPVSDPFPWLKLCSVWATIGVFWGQNAARVHDCARLADSCVRDRGAHGQVPCCDFLASLVAPLDRPPISQALGGGGGVPGKSQNPPGSRRCSWTLALCISTLFRFMRRKNVPLHPSRPPSRSFSGSGKGRSRRWSLDLLRGRVGPGPNDRRTAICNDAVRHPFQPQTQVIKPPWRFPPFSP